MRCHRCKWRIWWWQKREGFRRKDRTDAFMFHRTCWEKQEIEPVDGPPTR